MRVRIESGESMFLTSVGIVAVVLYARLGGCRLRTRQNGVSFVEQSSWKIYAYVNGVTYLPRFGWCSPI